LSGLDEITSKRDLRSYLKHLRSSLTASERASIDHAIAERVVTSDAWGKSSLVYTYLSFADEVDTRELIGAAFEAGKRVALPRVVGPRLMRWFEVHDLDNLETNRYGIEEPPLDVRFEVDPLGGPDAIALVPGLAFDRGGYRIGYGGGFYDGFLAGFRGVSVGLCRSITYFDEIPLLESHDRAVTIVVREASQVHECPKMVVSTNRCVEEADSFQRDGHDR
jgi:5-formyltetrahydrofolate cyclo-ligase